MEKLQEKIAEEDRNEAHHKVCAVRPPSARARSPPPLQELIEEVRQQCTKDARQAILTTWTVPFNDIELEATRVQNMPAPHVC